MKLLIVRHAIARDKKEFRKHNKNDDLRSLTKDGKKKMRRNVKRLKKMVPKIAKLFSSPLVRSVQTAEILAQGYAFNGFQGGFKGGFKEVEILRPEASFPSFLVWLKRQKRDGVVAVVGHEPHLSGLVGWLLTGKSHEFTELKKGGACLLEFSKMKQGKAKLLWLWDPTAG